MLHDGVNQHPLRIHGLETDENCNLTEMSWVDVLLGEFVILAVSEGLSLDAEGVGIRFYRMVIALSLNDSLVLQKMKE